MVTKWEKVSVTQESVTQESKKGSLDDTIGIIFASIDGHGVVWIDQQMLIPSVSFVVDASEKTVNTVIEKFPKEAQAETKRLLMDDSTGFPMTFASGAITLKMCYKNGKFYGTTNPLGLGSIFKSDHGFVKHPVVARSLGAIPKNNRNMIALFRPTAIIDQLAIPLGMAGNETLTAAVTGYRAKLETTSDSRAWFTIGCDGKQTKVEAEGLIGLIGPIGIPSLMMGYGEILKRVNIN
jgi:hypothetical protein